LKNRIFFRADASFDIGYGHFIRSLALADMLKDDFECVFFTCHPTSYQKQEINKTCSFVVLNESTHYEDFLSYLSGNEIVVLDNYFFTTEYQCQIKSKGCKLVCIDDMHDKHYVADLVINHALHDASLFDVESYTKLALGYQWALLRRPFFEGALKEKPMTIKKIAICFGGSDELNLTNSVIEKIIEQRPNVSITAIIGDANDNKVRNISPKINYLYNLSAQEVANVFSSADLSVVPTSSVCLESLACGTFVAAGTYCDNQKLVYLEYIKNNLIFPLGDMTVCKAEKLNLDEIESRFRILSRLDFIKKTPLRYVELFNKLIR